MATPWESGTPRGSDSGPAPSASSANGAVIDWRDEPATLVYPPDVNQPVTHPVLYRRCTSADLRAISHEWGVGAGVAAQRVTLTNDASTPCSLDGQPLAFDNRLTSGKVVLVPLVPHAGYGRNLDAVANLLPGQSGFTDVTVSDDCPEFQHRSTVTTFALELPDRTRVTIAHSSGMWAPPSGCSVSASSFGTPHVQVPDPTYPVDPLKLTVQLPRSVRAGTWFDYTVTLTNPTSAAVPLTPCPTYQENWKPVTQAAALSRAYRLNCDGHPEVPPHQALTFRMRMIAPATALVDWLGWTIQPSETVFGGGMVTVTG